MNPTQLRAIFNLHSGDDEPAKYKTWTQIAKMVEWPPCKNAVFMFWRNTIIVGANYDDETKTALYEWRKKYSLNKIPRTTDDRWKTIDRNNNYEAWKRMYINAIKQSVIERKQGISPAY